MKSSHYIETEAITFLQSKGYKLWRPGRVWKSLGSFIRHVAYSLTWLIFLFSFWFPFSDEPQLLVLFPQGPSYLQSGTLTIAINTVVFTAWSICYPGPSILVRIFGFLMFPFALLIYHIPMFLYRNLSFVWKFVKRVPWKLLVAAISLTSVVLAASSDHKGILELALLGSFSGAGLTMYMTYRWVNSPYGYLSKLAVLINKVPGLIVGDLLEKIQDYGANKDAKAKAQNILNVLTYFDLGNRVSLKLANPRLLLWVFTFVFCFGLFLNFFFLASCALVYAKLGAIPIQSGFQFLDVMADVCHYFFQRDGRYLNFNALPTRFCFSIYGLTVAYLIVIVTAFSTISTQAAEQTRRELVTSLEQGRLELLEKLRAFRDGISEDTRSFLMADEKLKAEFDKHLPIN